MYCLYFHCLQFSWGFFVNNTSMTLSMSITHRWHYQSHIDDIIYLGLFLLSLFWKPMDFYTFLYFWIILNLKWKWECFSICHFNALCPTVYIVYMARYKLVMPDSVFSSSIVLSTHQLTQQSYKKNCSRYA